MKFNKTYVGLFILGFVFLFSMQPSFANNRAVQIALIAWFQQYQDNPKPEQIPKMLQDFTKNEYLNKPGAAYPITAFFMIIFQKYPDQIKIWLEPLKDLSHNNKAILYTALWQSNNKKAQEYLEELYQRADKKEKMMISQIRSRKIIDLMKVHFVSTEIIDMMWASYYASGDTKYISRVLAILEWENPLDKTNVKNLNRFQAQQAIMITTAKWSLSSNAKHDAKVKEYLKEKEKDAPEKIKKLLKQIISQAGG